MNVMKCISASMLCFFISGVHADPRDFTLVNGTPKNISRLYVSHNKDDDWGPDILRNPPRLGPGESTNVSFTSPANLCRYDIKVVFNDSTPYWTNINICQNYKLTIWYDHAQSVYRLNLQ